MDRGGGGRGRGYYGWKAKAFGKKRGNTGGRGRGRGKSNKDDAGSSTRGNRGGRGYPPRPDQNQNVPTVSRSPDRNNGDNNEDSGDDSINYRPIVKKMRRQPTITSKVLGQLADTYPGFRLYFHPPSLPEFPDCEQKIKAALKFLLEKGSCENREYLVSIEEQEFFDVDYKKLVNDKDFQESWPTFSEDFNTNPEHVFKIFGIAMHKIIFEAAKETDKEEDMLNTTGELNSELSTIQQYEINLPLIRCGIMKEEPLTPLRSIKASLLDKFVTVRGAVVRTGINRLQCTRLTFRCRDCRKEFFVEQPEGRFTPPKKCGASESCENTRKDHFDPKPNAPETKVIECRRIRIQDVDHSLTEHGRIPKVIDCDLYYDLVNRCGAGDVVTLCGIVRLSSESATSRGVDKSMHSLYVEVFAMRNNKDSDMALSGGWCSYNDDDHQLIRNIFDTENLFRYLVASLCPSIYGHELVKAGILLALFGGSQHGQQGNISCRPDINVLMVGDPGLGKSQMLKVTSQVAPRGVYVCGSGSTTAGLTVTLVRDGNDYALDAGALVLADQGTCCIDEFDKMQSQHSALLEAMEQQSVSLAKAGVFRTLPARTCVIAAANPVGGHYDNHKTVSDNIRISAALLSRFDLIFIMLDRPNMEYDRTLVDHVTGFSRKNPRKDAENGQSPLINDPLDPEDVVNVPLRQRLKVEVNEALDLLQHDKLRKYIAYAKQYVKPKISEEAAALIKAYYLDLREHHRCVDSTPVTTRQLESLVRLAEARAKLELREEVTKQDAQDIIDIFKCSMSGVYDNDSMVVSGFSQELFQSPYSGKVSSGTSRSQTKNMSKKLIAAIQMSSSRLNKTIFSEKELKDIAQSYGLPVGEAFYKLVDTLNNQNYLIKKGPRLYQFQCGDS